MDKIKVAIIGYGNLGRGVQLALEKTEDMQLVGIFTRRSPDTVSPVLDNAKVYHIDTLLQHKDEIDVVILCGGSATDLPKQTPAIARDFNVVDSFDTHANIPVHFENVDRSAREGNNVAIISIGWDPGLFSLNRMMADAIMPNGHTYTFWGKGVSQGHSDAVRRIEGVIDARQYTIPVDSALNAIRNGETPDLTTREKHKRECFVVVEDNADKARIESEIVNMPKYFSDYDTTVHFISKEEMDRDHSGIPHGGSVIFSNTTGVNQEHTHVIEYKLKLDSNPEFTSSVLVAYARAAYRLSKEGNCGCRTIFDVAPAYLSPKSAADLRSTLL